MSALPDFEEAARSRERCCHLLARVGSLRRYAWPRDELKCESLKGHPAAPGREHPSTRLEQKAERCPVPLAARAGFSDPTWHWNWPRFRIWSRRMSSQNRGGGVIDSARDVLEGSCRLRALLPGLLFVMFVVAFAGVGAGAETRSLLLISVCVAAVAATLAALAAWTLVTERFAHHSAELPRDVAWHPSQWAEFERAFWSYVDGDARPQAAE